ncbi:MAG: DUF1614 domain-containing protein [bacterium]
MIIEYTHASSFPLLLFIIFILLFLFKIHIMKHVYEKVGIPLPWISLLLFLSLAGSFIDIPLWQISPSPQPCTWFLRFFSLTPPAPPSKITIAMNVGGAIIPIFISLSLLSKAHRPERTMLAIFFVSIIVHAFARPVPHIGITVPTLLPAASAALSAYLFDRQAVSRTAYIAGSMGTLIGADLAYMFKLGDLGISIASIGGMGTFDGIYVSGIMAVLMA